MPPLKAKTLAANAVGIILSALFVPLIIINFTFMVKSGVVHENPPSAFGFYWLVVTDHALDETGDPDLNAGDLAFATKADQDNLKENEIIAYHNPERDGVTSIGRIKKVQSLGEEKKIYLVKGDPSTGSTIVTISPDDVVGRYVTRLKHGGNLALFMNSDLGAIVCIVLPLAGFLLYDFFRRRKYPKEAEAAEDKAAEPPEAEEETASSKGQIAPQKEKTVEKTDKEEKQKRRRKPSKDEELDDVMEQYAKYLEDGATSDDEEIYGTKGINPKPKYYVVPKNEKSKQNIQKKVRVTVKRKKRG